MSLKDVRNTFNDVITEVCDHHKTIILQKSGKAVAAIVDIELFEKINVLNLNFNKLYSELGQVYQDVPIAEAEADIGEALSSLEDKK